MLGKSVKARGLGIEAQAATQSPEWRRSTKKVQIISNFGRLDLGVLALHTFEKEIKSCSTIFE